MKSLPKLTMEERETGILFSEGSTEALIWSNSSVMTRRLTKKYGNPVLDRGLSKWVVKRGSVRLFREL